MCVRTKSFEVWEVSFAFNSYCAVRFFFTRVTILTMRIGNLSGNGGSSTCAAVQVMP